MEHLIGEVGHWPILPGQSALGAVSNRPDRDAYDVSMPDVQLPTVADAVWRPLSADDAGAMSALQQACFGADGGYRMTASEMREEFDRFGDDAPICSIGAFASDGRLLAFGWAQVPDGGVTEHRGFIWMEVDPAHRATIADGLLAWVEDAGALKLRQIADGVPTAMYRYEVYEWMADTIALMERHGYEIVRYVTENVRDLALPIEDRPLPDGLVARPWSVQAEADALGVHNAALADHWGSQPIEDDRWRSHNAGEFFEEGASWVAYDGSTAVAYVRSAKYPQDFEDRGRSESWIEGVATIRSHRGRGIASALMTMAMRGFRDDDMEYACLAVDSENPTGANRIYERLGFVPEKRTMVFRKPIGASS
jgi:mycothiol synthase